ncbi:MAG: Fur family transcriptional regulator [Mycobacterium sp.]
MASVEDPDTLTALFRRQGLKVTPQRQSIFRVLHGNTTHPTADAVYAAARAEMPTISLKTVYETLHRLAVLGKLQQLDVGTGAARFDPGGPPHPHLVCLSCGAVENVEGEVGEVKLTTGQLHGFVVRHADIVFHGLCPACAARATA